MHGVNDAFQSDQNGEKTYIKRIFQVAVLSALIFIIYTASTTSYSSTVVINDALKWNTVPFPDVIVCANERSSLEDERFHYLKTHSDANGTECPAETSFEEKLKEVKKNYTAMTSFQNVHSKTFVEANKANMLSR